MGYIEKIQSDLTAAMKEKDELRLSVLRMVKSALKLKEIDKMRPLDDLESLQILQTLIKQRKESVEQFTQGRAAGSRGQGSERNRDHREVSARRSQRRGDASRRRGGHQRIRRGFPEANGRRGEGRARQTGRQVH